MKVTMEIPDPPAGCDTPKWTRLGLPIGERVWVLVAKDWWQAESFISTGGNYWIACNMQPERSRPAKCTACGREINLDDASSFKTGMHGGMHFYVCSTKCLWDVYKPKPGPAPEKGTE